MSIKENILECFEENKPLTVSLQFLEEVQLDDIFAMIHIIELKRNIFYDQEFNAMREDRLYFENDGCGYSCRMKMDWPHQNFEFAAMALVLCELFTDDSPITSIVRYINQQAQPRFVYPNPEEFLAKAEHHKVIHHPATRYLMKAIGVEYSRPEDSQEFFNNYLGLDNTKSARS